MTASVVHMVGVSKILGKRTVLADVNLSVKAGEVVGIIGANGSGKTTLLRLLCGLMYPDCGEIRVAGHRIAPGLTGRMPVSVGVLIESPGFLPQFSGMKNLLFLAGIRRVIGHKEVADCMARVGLDPANRQAVRKYSLGMRQRLGIAQAVMELPQVLLLDEPTNSLDKEGVAAFAQIIHTFSAQGVGIVMASHVMEEINAWCDHVFTLEGGKLTKIRTGRERQWLITLRQWSDVEKLARVFPSIRVTDPMVAGPTVACTGPWSAKDDLAQLLRYEQVDVLHIEAIHS